MTTTTQVHSDFALAAYPIVLRFVRRKVGDCFTAEDITQDAFAAVHGRGDFDPSRSDAVGFLKTKASWLVRDYRRRLARKAEPLPDDLADAQASQPDDVMERDEVCAMVRRGVAGLSAPHREVVVRRLAGMDHDQIAADLDVPVAVVYRRFHAAKAALRRILPRAARPD